jgi:hypothetical protein
VKEPKTPKATTEPEESKELKLIKVCLLSRSVSELWIAINKEETIIFPSELPN